jgi:hypothetical protein
MTSRSLGKRAVTFLATLGLVGAMFGAIVVPAASASTSGPAGTDCAGTLDHPGILGSGTYGSVTVSGFCYVPPGSTIVASGAVTVRSTGFLLAAGLFDQQLGVPGAPTCDRSITIQGGVVVWPGGSLVLGDGEGSGCATRTHTVVSNGVTANGAIDLIIHGVVVNGGVTSIGGGDHGACNFDAPTGPVYATVEDSQINGGVTVSGYTACWLGFARNHINGSVTLKNNHLDDPDAMEILANSIKGGLSCSGNSPTPTNVADGTLFEPNTVTGSRSGQCAGL